MLGNKALPNAHTSRNPFATRYVAPGKLPWIESEFGEIEMLTARFAALGSRAQIVGPHGSGKTTLLHHLVNRLSRANEANPDEHLTRLKDSQQCLWLTLRRGSNSLPVLRVNLRRIGSGDLLVLDGFEQLNWFQQYWIRALTRWKNCRLLVTCHTSVGLPTLRENRLTIHLAENIVRQLLQNKNGENSGLSCPDQLELHTLLRRHRGNMRECLMELYDRYEENRSVQPTCKIVPQQGEVE